MTEPHVRGRWERSRNLIHPVGVSMTEQSHAEASDINFIVHRFARTGQLPPPMRTPFYGDVTNLQGPLQERLQWAGEIIDRHNLALSQAEPPSESPPNPSPAAPQEPQIPPPTT